jgi:hypothetical protein
MGVILWGVDAFRPRWGDCADIARQTCRSLDNRSNLDDFERLVTHVLRICVKT